nr:tautomerase family protein [Agrobacterium vitis]
MRRITDMLVEELGRNPEYVFVVIDEIDTDNWGRKGVTLTDLWQRAKTDTDTPLVRDLLGRCIRQNS